jgi:membrane-associated phospholipid phosphatase
LLLLATLPSRQPLCAQVRRADPPADAAVIGAGTVAALLPRVLGIGPRVPECVPCDPRTLPAVDRWVVREPDAAWGWASDVALAGVVAFGVLSMSAREGGGPYVTGMIEAGVWTVAATEWLKAGVGRHRPVLYTDAAPAAAGDRNNLRSFPSGHASLAFAVATSYWLGRRDLHGRPGGAAWALAGGAVGVGVFRVIAGKHFLTDVLAGALLGMVGGGVTHAIKF